MILPGCPNLLSKCSIFMPTYSHEHIPPGHYWLVLEVAIQTINCHVLGNQKLTMEMYCSELEMKLTCKD